MRTGGCSEIWRDAWKSISGSSDKGVPIKGRLTDVLQVLAGLEPNCAPGWDANLFTRPGVAADAALAGLYLEHAEAAELNPVASLHRHPHRIEHRVDGYLGLDLGNVSDFRNLVDDVDLDHPLGA